MSEKSQIVHVISLDCDSEEKLVISNGRASLTCFGSNSPLLYPGRDYRVMLSLMIFDEYKIEQQPAHSEEDIDQPTGTYRCRITGHLRAGCLYSCGYVFYNEALESEYSYLDGATISLTADRINLDLL